MKGGTKTVVVNDRFHRTFKLFYPYFTLLQHNSILFFEENIMASFGSKSYGVSKPKGQGSAGSRSLPRSGGQMRSLTGAKSSTTPRVSDRLNPKTIDPVS